ncbi:hypothetical protein EYF80_043993 [Liparis tanakae]|uniref:Uncharacterized protein n=1 Tax=Liparis tanakae TaxID=230148 RepID=A0A4Z2FY48_9TELE|nr:hypothetical protein EYF80_043993 [Liparis tanakae]
MPDTFSGESVPRIITLPRFLTTQQPCSHGNTVPEESTSALPFGVSPVRVCIRSIRAKRAIRLFGVNPLIDLYPDPEPARTSVGSAWHRFAQWAEQHGTAGSIRCYVTQHRPRRPRSHYPSTPTPPPTSAPVVICRLRCIVIEECSSSGKLWGVSEHHGNEEEEEQQNPLCPFCQKAMPVPDKPRLSVKRGFERATASPIAERPLPVSARATGSITQTAGRLAEASMGA